LSKEEEAVLDAVSIEEEEVAEVDSVEAVVVVEVSVVDSNKDHQLKLLKLLLSLMLAKVT